MANANNAADQKLIERLVNQSADFLDAHRSAKAKAICIRVIALDPGIAEAWSNLACAELQLGDPERARKAAEKALEILPLYPMAWVNLAEALLLGDDTKGSLFCSNRALTLNARGAKAWSTRANALMSLQRFAESEACFERAFELAPDNTLWDNARRQAAAYADPERGTFLFELGGLASLTCDEQDDVVSEMLGRLLTSHRLQVDRDLVLTLDNNVVMFAQNDLKLARSLCRCNSILASALDDEALRRACRARMKTLS
jgi:tetratricopeptide (TPR) repeat protein